MPEPGRDRAARARHRSAQGAAVLLCWVVLAGRGLAQTPARERSVSGVVVDETGAVLPAARVALVDAGGRLVGSDVTTPTGTFAIAAGAGPYTLRVSLDGFRTQNVQVPRGRQPKPVRIVLELAALHQEVTVTGGAQVTTSASGNANAIGVSQSALESLPIFDDDAVATVSNFLNSGSLGTGGVTLLVNGMEVNSLDVSTSAIQQIKINDDPYSAAYSRPGRGRINIITKPGSEEYHGSMNLIARDARLNARNAFADVRPPEQRRIADAFLGGPVGNGHETSFMASLKADSEDRQAIVFALGPQGDIHGAVAQPFRHLLASFGVTRQHGRSTISIRPSYEKETDAGRGVGGTTLGSAGTTYSHREIDLSYNQQTVFRPTLLNQFQILVGHELEPMTSDSPAPGLVVNGAFTGGGAQVDLHRTELHFQLAENIALTRGRHFLQAGFQVPDWSRRGFYDRSGFGGTYYFADLAAYAAGQPYSFVQQRGNGDVVWLEKVLGFYVNDDWQLSPSATVSLGMRYDWSNYFEDHDNLAPRGSFAIRPGGSEATVVRGGAGLFYDKVGPFPIIDVLNFRPGGLQRIVISNPAYPDPFASGATVASAPPSIAQFAPGIQVPWTLEYSVGVERQLRKAATLSVTYYGTDARRFRSRDINAPLPPLYLSRPDPAFGQIRQIESTGRQRGQSVEVTLRGRFGRLFSGQAQYTLSRVMNDSGGVNWFPANDYDLSGEWARADFDRRHRLVALGSVTPGHRFTLGMALTLQSGLPYTELLGTDPYNNGRGGARPPGVPRNSLQRAGYADVDVRLAREFPLGGRGGAARTLTLGVDAFNVLNQVNYGVYVGTVGSPLFGQPVNAHPARQIQLSGRLKF